MKTFPIDANSKYYKGGFEPKMSRREASLILGVSPTASKVKIKVRTKGESVFENSSSQFFFFFSFQEAHKRIMLLNHPDRGGSPYIAAKINEAKDFLESSSNK